MSFFRLVVLSVLGLAWTRPVQLTICYESLCPGCMDLISGDLQGLWKTEGFPQILNLTMLPYGNARGSGTDIVCQHGLKECQMNMVEACAIKHLPDPRDYMPFIFCSERAARKSTPAAIIAACATGSAAGAITACYGDGKGSEGIALESALAKQTALLQHKYTPWVVIDGVHSTQGEDHLLKAICKAYKGPSPPAACAKHADRRCFRPEAAPEAREAPEALVSV
mmetsp:Transcript_107124/g.302930  ORF Transcript_107124/g.302930 Transcript_107124/m.302930 type:complete len:224 (-) Transcript_107124:276-947(-)